MANIKRAIDALRIPVLTELDITDLKRIKNWKKTKYASPMLKQLMDVVNIRLSAISLMEKLNDKLTGMCQ
jgi:hypothetical protein